MTPVGIHKAESEAKPCLPSTIGPIQKGPIGNPLWMQESTVPVGTVQETADLPCD